VKNGNTAGKTTGDFDSKARLENGKLCGEHAVAVGLILVARFRVFGRLDL